ncbi:MAG: energy transducer TonB [Sphingomonadales bacterium]
MVQSAFLEQKRHLSPAGLGVIIAVHAALITAFALWKIEVIRQHVPRTIVQTITTKPDPVEHPLPGARHPQHVTRLTQIDQIVKTEQRDDAELSLPKEDGTIAPTDPQATDPLPPLQPPHIEQAARARGDVRTLFVADDYPLAARERQESGTVQVRLGVGADGRVTGCDVIASSGSALLDRTTCRVLKARAKFTPARDGNGQPTGDSYTTPKIVWRIEG